MPEQELKSVMVRVAGKPFACACGCNVFHHPDGHTDIFRCNACGSEYAEEGNP